MIIGHFHFSFTRRPKVDGPFSLCLTYLSALGPAYQACIGRMDGREGGTRTGEYDLDYFAYSLGSDIWHNLSEIHTRMRYDRLNKYGLIEGFAWLFGRCVRWGDSCLM
jgi:hypothetical protein